MAKRTRRTQRAPRDPVANNPDGSIAGGDETARRAWECRRSSRTHLQAWRAEAVENYDFVASHQWTEEDLAKLQEEQRAAITFNRCMATISAISGYEINGRQDVTYLPRQPEESGEAEVDTQAAKYFRQESDAEDEESDQFRDMMIAGLGWTEHRMDYDADPEGMMRVERTDPLEMDYDPSAVRPNLTDRRWDIRGKWWDKKVAQEKWPKADFSVAWSPAEDDMRDGQPPIDRLEAAFYRAPGVGEQGQKYKDKVFILEFTWFEHAPFYTVVNPTSGQTEDVEPAIHRAFQERLEEAGLPPARSVKRTRKVFKRAFVHGPDTLEEGDAPCPENFHYQAITAHRDRNKNIWFGIVSLMKDPQRWANKWLSQFLHLLNTNAKTGMFYEDGVFERPGEVERKIAKPGFSVQTAMGAISGGRLKINEPTPIPQDAMGLMEYAIGSIRDVTGVNIELMGQTQNEQPGVVENARKQSAMTILAPLFAAQRQYRKMAGRLTLYFIRTYLSDGRFIRIAGQANAKYVRLAKRDGNPKYDIIVDQSPNSPNQKEAVFGVLASILPQLMKQGLPIPPELLDYVPGLPAQLAEKWKQLIEQKAAQPQQDPKQQIEMAKLQAQQQESANQDRIDTGRLQFDQQKAQMDNEASRRDADLKRMELEVRREEIRSKERIELAKFGHSIVQDHTERQHDAAEAERDRAHERAEAHATRAHASGEAAADREHKSAEGSEERTVKRETLKAKAKPAPRASA